MADRTQREVKARGARSQQHCLHQSVADGLRERDRASIEAFCQFFWDDIERLVWHLMGDDADHDDVVQDVLMKAARYVHTVRESSALRAWLVRLTVNTVRNRLRYRRLRSWLTFLPDERITEPKSWDDHDAQAAVKRAFELIEQLPTDERVAFALRRLDGLELKEAASAANTSLATFKRRLRTACARLAQMANADPDLRRYLLGDGEEKEEDNSP